MDWRSLYAEADDLGKDLMSVVKPYLPVLAREGPEFFEGFIKNLRKGDFEKIDQSMYAKMSSEERVILETEVLQGAFEATRAKFRRKELIKEIGLKIMIRVLMRVATGGL